jgi:hypothetical protein
LSRTADFDLTGGDLNVGLCVIRPNVTDYTKESARCVAYRETGTKSQLKFIATTSGPWTLVFGAWLPPRLRQPVDRPHLGLHPPRRLRSHRHRPALHTDDPQSAEKGCPRVRWLVQIGSDLVATERGPQIGHR